MIDSASDFSVSMAEAALESFMRKVGHLSQTNWLSSDSGRIRNKMIVWASFLDPWTHSKMRNMCELIAGLDYDKIRTIVLQEARSFSPQHDVWQPPMKQSRFLSVVPTGLDVEISAYALLPFNPTVNPVSFWKADFFAMDEICRDSALILVNTDEVVEFPRPIYHNIVFIGGFAASSNQSEQSLSSPYHMEVTKGKLGLIYFSLGTNVQTSMLPDLFKQRLVDIFSSFEDYHFILKVDEGDELTRTLARKHPNIFATNWAPQAKILAHPRTRLFISHGGYNGLLESASNGVPAVFVPFFGDQLHNAKLAERNGWGLSVDKTNIMAGTEDFRKAIHTVLANQSFSTNARRTKRLIETKPFSSNEKLLKNIKFLELNNGQVPELMSEGRMLGVLEFYNWDIIFLAGLLLLGTLVLLAALVGWLAKKYCCRSDNKRATDSNKKRQ